MSVSATDPLLPSAVQREGTRSFTVELEEAAALPLGDDDDDISSAVPHTPLLEEHNNSNNKKSVLRRGGSAADVDGVSPAVASSSSVGSSFGSPGVSTTADNRTQPQSKPQHAPQQHVQPEWATSVQVGGGGAAPLSRRSTNAAPANATFSVRLLTCQSDTPAEQRTREIEASRSLAFHPTIVCPLQNLGNTCYFNSGVQMLANCPALIYGLRHAPFFQVHHTNSPLQSGATTSVPATSATTKLCLRGGDSTHALFEEFARLMNRMENNELDGSDALSPVRALDALARVYTQFEGRSQQDAAEMMTAVLASVDEEGGQYAEVEQLLSSFAEDAVMLMNQQASAQASGDTASGSNTNSSRGQRQHPPHHHSSRLQNGNTTGTSTSSGGNARTRSEPYCSEEYSPASAMLSQKVSGDGAAAAAVAAATTTAVPGARSAHEMAMLRFMKQVNVENEQLERRVKQRQGKPYLGTFRPPRLRYNPIMDGFRGYAVSQVECHHCHSVSRVVSDYNAILLDIPTSRQRSQFLAKHPNLRRVGPAGQPLQAKKHAGFTWWNPLTFFTSAWDRFSRLFSSGVPFPLTLQECLDIHFEPVKLQGSNKYRCDSCGTTSEATKSETLLGLPEYLVLHMKRFEAGRCFNSKKTDPVIFPASWSPLAPREAAKAKLPTAAVPEILDLRRYLHPVAAPFAEPIPPCLQSTLGVNLATTTTTAKSTAGAAAAAPQRAAASEGEVPPSSPQRPSTSPLSAPHHRSNSNYHNNNNNNSHSTMTADGGRSTPPPPPPQSSQVPAPVLTVDADGSAPWAIPTTYTLDGIINHHGGYDGGHYTVYLYKTSPEKQMWVYISDDEIERASAGDAADSEEYVLLYRRQPIVQPAATTDEGEQLRQKACYYLSRNNSADTADGVAAGAGAGAGSVASRANPLSSSSGAEPASSTPSSSTSPSTPAAAPPVYISRMWLQRVAFLREPGPIVNRLCYCSPEEQKKVATHRSLFPVDVAVPAEVPHVHGPPVDWFYVPVSATDYAIFYDAFGGNAAVTAAEVAAIRAMQEQFVAKLATAERAKGRSSR